MKTHTLIAFLLMSIFALHLRADHSVDDTSTIIDEYLQRAVQNGYSGVALVAEKDVVFKKPYGKADREKGIENTPEKIFDIGSLTKQFTAAAILKLESQGKLKVTDSIANFFDAVPEGKKSITIHQLLTHTSGLRDGLGPDEDLINRDDYLKLAFSSELSNQSGAFSYSNVGYSVLAAIVEKVSGKEYEECLKEIIFAPAGMHHTGYVLPHWNKTEFAIGYANNRRWGTTFDQSQYEKYVTWHLKGNGGIHSTVDDLLKWCKALQGNQILPPAAREKFFYPHVSASREDSHYAYGWRVYTNDRKEKVITHNGGNGYFMATILMIPSRSAYFIVFSNNSPKNTDTIALKLDRIVNEDFKGLPAEFRKKYEGIYSLDSGNKIKISFDENDSAITVLNNRDSFLMLSGSQFDDGKKQAEYDQRTKSFLQAVIGGKTEEAIKLSGLNANEIRQIQNEMQQSGAVKNIEILGSVARRRGNLYLSIGKIQSEKEDLYRMFVWEGDTLSDLQAMPDGNTKTFEYKSGNEFYSPSNDKKIFLIEDEGKPILLIDHQSKKINARKIS